MEDLEKQEKVAAESEVLNIASLPGKKVSRRSSSSSKKWVILIIIVILAVIPAVFILFRSSGDTIETQSYEECVKECVVKKDTGEVDVPYGNCFEYCRENVLTPEVEQ